VRGDVRIRRPRDEGSTELTDQIREDLWVVHVASKLSCLADLAAVKTPVDVEVDTIVAHLAELRHEALDISPKIEEILGCTRVGCRAGCNCDDDVKERRREQRAALLSLLHTAEANATL
jgi:hypothetical protein